MIRAYSIHCELRIADCEFLAAELEELGAMLPRRLRKHVDRVQALLNEYGERRYAFPTTTAPGYPDAEAWLRSLPQASCGQRISPHEI